MMESLKVGRTIDANIASRLSRNMRLAHLRLNEVAWTWYARARSRRALAQLNDHVLKDIGVSRVDVYRETTKPFWRD
jgi:uncharacterized protein YjiS (DUF1127 family)